MLRGVLLAVFASLALGAAAVAADSWTEIRYAVYMGQLEKTAELLESGIDVNLQNDEGWTPLMVAAEQGNAAMVRFLLDRGADPGLRSTRGRTAYDVTTSAEVQRLLRPASAAPSAPTARPGAAAASAKPAAAAKVPTTTEAYCKKLGGQVYLLCDSSDLTCKIRASNKTQACLKTGRWP